MRRSYRYYDLVMAAFVTVLLCANLIAPGKIGRLEIGGFPLTFGAGVLFFPVSYIFGDILTEVYGYARARKVVWAGFAAMAFASFMATVVVAIPPAPGRGVTGVLAQGRSGGRSARGRECRKLPRGVDRRWWR